MSFIPPSSPILFRHQGETLESPLRRSGLYRPEEAEASWGRSAQQVCKRFIDLVGASLGLTMLSPLMLGIALLIRVTSRGPALFLQTRIGRNGKPFVILKFRTMVVDAEERLKELEPLNESQGGVLFKIRKDPRVMPIGAFLRRTSLDELPQLFNILLGQMSLVGPRPLQLRDCNLLKEVDEEGYTDRLRVVPGLTGMWQVRGRSETGFDHMLQLDLDYIERWSLMLDLKILSQTIIAVITRDGAY
jgi:lipopolysaccharide/colanic/teichoic acid biosynthesis glycosyltransferase